MNYKYIVCKLPSNGLIYDTKEVHLRAKTIFDIKALLNNPSFQIRAEIETLQQCLDPKDGVDVYDLINQDVVYLLYKLRSLSNDILPLKYKNQEYNINISDMDVVYLEEWNTEFECPESKKKITLKYTPIRNVLNLNEQVAKFKEEFPDYSGDAINTVAILNSVIEFDGMTNKAHIMNALAELGYKDSLFIIDKITEMARAEFGVKEEAKIVDKETGEEVTVPIVINENFFRATL